MEIQWSLVIFTFFVCLTCGLLSVMAINALQNKGAKLQMTALIASGVSLVIGGIGSFTHLKHWERIFNGFGHITSGITQELIGCVALAIIIVLWFVFLRKAKDAADAGIPKWLSIATIVVAVAMVCATGHSYLMPSKPAWSVALIVFYLCNACLLGPLAMWIIAAAQKDTEAEESAIKFTFIGGIIQVLGEAVYTVACATAKFANYGYYADPTTMTTTPNPVDSLINLMVSGSAAPMFWLGVVAAVVAAAVAAVARGKAGKSTALAVVVLVAAVAASFAFRVLFYQLGVSAVQLY